MILFLSSLTLPRFLAKFHESNFREGFLVNRISCLKNSPILRESHLYVQLSIRTFQTLVADSVSILTQI
ncbi:hypothetical protein L596_018181 [Steinernema carpocapsae]|uniref:Uncharacterized protein n=1 Tax=Steinernema carpocapsae TaxID=34508 RepID=A0A4U5N453_STECR|nr:hypothetical protein L596_018181 [Steinernema carpocapsae]